MSSKLDRRVIVPWGTLVVAAALLLASGGRYLTSQTLAQIAIGGLLLLTLMLPRSRPFPWRWALGLLGAVSLASLAGSVNLVASIEELSRWAAFFSVAYIGWRTVDETYRPQLSLAIVGLGTLAAAGGLVDVVVHHYDVAASFFNRSNDLAAYLLLTLPLSLVLASAESRSWRSIGRTAFAAQLLALVMCQSRAALLAGGLGIAMLLVLAAGVQRRRMATTVAGITLVGAVVLGPQVARFGTRFLALAEAMMGGGSETSTPWRQALWRAAWQMGLDHPLLGTGPGTYAAASRAYQDTAGYYSINAHNFYLQLWGEMGLLGILAWGLLIGGILWAAWRVRQFPAESRAPSAALAAGVCASLLHIAFDLDWSVMAIPVLFWLMAGMLLAAVTPGEEDPEANAPALSRIGRLAIGLVLIVLPARTAVATHLHAKADRTFAGGDPAAAIEIYRKAQKALPWPSASWSGDLAQAHIANGQLAEAMRALADSRRLDPLNGAYPLQQAILHARTGAISDAIAAAEAAIALNPYRHPGPYLTLATWLEAQGQRDKALERLYLAKERFPSAQIYAYEDYTPGDRYELVNVMGKLQELEAARGNAAAASDAGAYARRLLTEQRGTPGVAGPHATPTGVVTAYWQSYDAGQPLVGVLPGAKVAAPPPGLPEGELKWHWLQRDRKHAQVIYERPGVPAKVVDELELRDSGWYIVRRRGLAQGTAAEANGMAPIKPAGR